MRSSRPLRARSSGVVATARATARTHGRLELVQDLAQGPGPGEVDVPHGHGVEDDKVRGAATPPPARAWTLRRK